MKIRTLELNNTNATYDLHETQNHLVLAKAIQGLLRSKRQLDNVEIHHLLDMMIDRADNLVSDEHDSFDFNKQFDEDEVECLPDDRAIYDIEDLLMRLPTDGKKITDAEKNKFIDEISNVIGILEAEGGRDEEVQKLQAA